jgi:hypothetical protein
MAPILSYQLSSGSKKKEPRYVCLSEAKASLILKTSKKVLKYIIHFSQKPRQTNPLQIPQKGAYIEGGQPTGHCVTVTLDKIISFGNV